MSIWNSSRKATVVAIAMIALAFAGCTDDDNPSDPGSNDALVRPNVGSMFVTSTVEQDANGNTVAGTEEIDTIHVFSSNAAFAGRTNGIGMQDGSDTTYVFYEANGNVTVVTVSYDEEMDREQFEMTLPIGTKQTITMPTVDTTIDGIRMQSSGNVKYGSRESVQVPAGKFTTHSSVATANVSMTMPGFEMDIASETTIWFAPKIGFPARMKDKTTSNLEGTSYTQQTLKSYVLK